MTLPRRTLSVTAAAVLALTLASCSLLAPTSQPKSGRDGSVVPAPETPSGEALEMVDTSWSGIGSNGDEWTFLFQSDGTIGLDYNGSSYDDATDTWRLATDGEVILTISFDDGVATMTGEYRGLNQPLELLGSLGDSDWELAVRRE